MPQQHNLSQFIGKVSKICDKQILLKISVVILFCTINLQPVFAQSTLLFEDKEYDPGIQTVIFGKLGMLYSYPIMDMAKPEEPLLLAFDILDKQQLDLQYTIIHCNADWQPSKLFTNDYIIGSPYESVINYSASFNTRQRYIHYWLYLPGNYMMPKISGNYLVKVYLADNPDSVLLTRRFYVVDNKVLILSDIKRPTYAKYRDTKQEVDFTINYKDLNIMNPLNDIKVVIRQNHRWDNQITGLSPKYINDQTMYFDYEEENLFDGGSEFRYADLRTYLNGGYGVQNIYLDSFYNLYLYADDDRSYKSYSYWNEMNGERIISGDYENYRMNELDYFIVHFKLLTPYPYEEGDAYVFGALSDYQTKPEFRMNYMPDNKWYEAAIKLKQGYYNFQYVFVDKRDGKIDAGRFEGDHYETENDYLIFVYVRSSFLDADELLGFNFINSRKK